MTTVAVALWVLGSLLDEWTSWRMLHYADLREANPLAQTSTGRFSRFKGAIAKAGATVALGAVWHFNPVAGTSLFGICGAAVGGFALHNLWLEQHD